MGGGSDHEPQKLLKSVVNDAGRHFFDAPAALSMDECVIRLGLLEGVNVVSMMPAEIGQWLVFQFEGYAFSASNPFGEVWFFADDPETPDGILQKIALCVVGPTKAS
ncbi:hypothetical protein HY29_16175 [Hyphomonas beringensis]|uniref:Uncharacterized protein n=1 Tax=Hyphomonas beringensis TaxID=1280946 RepID=A0A062U7N8_9PROT|nr:hypothetical protein [Hyphomonas beringensis]KCZ53743.1 hypothetical protein HY29_16175 [Hyphomonas beringensis]